MSASPPADDLKALVALMPHAQALGITLESASPDGAVGRLEWTPERRPLHRGRSLVVVQTDLTDAGGRPVAQVVQSQAVLSRPA